MNRQLSWYWHRLRAMSTSEVTNRFSFAMKKQLWRRRTSWIAPQPQLSPPDNWTLPPLSEIAPSEREATLMEAERCLRGDYRWLNLLSHEAPIDWHRDPQTGTRAPSAFSLDIDFLDTKSVGNIKYLWEKNRHHHLTLLAFAFALTKEERFAQETRSQLESWSQQNPFLTGVNWASSLELGVRLISWTWIERLLRGSTVHEPLFGNEGVLWPAIYWHQWMIEQHHSHGSSANNHLIGEMAGLFVAASVWPVFDESDRWRARARAKLEQEIIKQTFPSGLNREQAFDYHLFTLDLFRVASAEAERTGSPLSSEYRSRLTRMLEALPQLTDFGGHRPRYGDGDDGMVVQPRALISQTPLSASPGRAAFEDAGLYILTSQRGTAQEVFVLADAGPHGYLSTAAHAHADALAFTLSASGKPILVDPGTSDYLMEPAWRNYFRGTSAHNTVVVDDLDQSTQAGPFLWTQKARTTVHHWETTDTGATLAASHDGYRRIGVIHRRCLELRGQTLTILDELQGTGEHETTLYFHLAPECEVEQISPTVINISRDGRQVRLTLPAALEVSLVCGGERAGWYSPHYGVKQPTWSVIARTRCRLPCSFKSVIEVTM